MLANTVKHLASLISRMEDRERYCSSVRAM